MMATRDRGKKPARATRRRTKKEAGPPAAPEAVGGGDSVQQALSLAQRQVEQSLKQIREEMARFQLQVMEAVRSVHGQQRRELTQARQAMEGALRGTGASASSSESEETDAAEPDDGREPGAAGNAVLRATGEGVENVRLAIGHVARAVGTQDTGAGSDRAVQEGLANVESAVRAASDPGGDATSEGVEGVRLAVHGVDAAVPIAGEVGRRDRSQHTVEDSTAEAVRDMGLQLGG